MLRRLRRSRCGLLMRARCGVPLSAGLRLPGRRRLTSLPLLLLLLCLLLHDAVVISARDARRCGHSDEAIVGRVE